MVWQQLASEWIRALRGRRSQRAASQRLGFGSNIFYRWEHGQCAPPSSTAFAVAEGLGVRINDAVLAFLGVSRRTSQNWQPLTTREGVSQLLARLRGNSSYLQLAERTSFNRFAVSRWCRGLSEPSLPELFEFIEATTHRVLDFVAAFVDPSKLPSVADQWQTHLALRNAAYDMPWSHAVLRVLELRQYAELPGHQVGWIADRIGLSLQEEESCLDVLRRSRQIEWKHRRWVVSERGTIDTGQDPARARQLRRFWQGEALRRFDDGAKGAFGYNLFTISTADYERLKELYLNYFESMRDLVSGSSPGEKLVLFCGQLVELDEQAATRSGGEVAPEADTVASKS